MRIINSSEFNIASFQNNEQAVNEEINLIVKDILQNVKDNGDKALFEYSEKFDKVKLESLKVSEQEIEEAYNKCDKYFLETLEIAKKNIWDYHIKQVCNGYEFEKNDGIILGQKVTAIEKVGIYVPGGTASYPSTVLMNSIPAKIAGVKQIIMVTPPNKEGKIAPEILCSAKIAGVTDIFKIGGAQAIGALAYGTQTIPKVHKIVGPGNVFVATAKRQVFGIVNIDMIAGPSEILVIADKKANYKNISADLLSQAEHDKLSASILITNSEELAKKVSEEVYRQIGFLPRKEICKEAIDNNGLIIVAKDLDEAIEISNLIAPEHLELVVEEPFKLLDSVTNAGSVFLGAYCPEALGDYMAGTNHTLPTSGTAKFSSALSVDDFIKKSSYMYYTKEALSKINERLEDFASREGLDAHKNSVAIRFNEDLYE